MDKRGDLALIAAFVALAAAFMLIRIVTYFPPEAGVQLAPINEGEVLINQCEFIIDTNGTYVLNASLTQTGSGNCITVNSDNVTIDGKGFMINGSGQGNGIFAEGRNNVIMRNINIVNFTYGIKFDFTNKSLIDSVSIYNSSSFSVIASSSSNNVISNVVSYGPGVYLQNSHFNNLVSNNMVGSGEGFGIKIEGNGNLIDRNTIRSCSSGIYFTSSSNNSVTNTLIDGCRNSIFLGAGSNFNNSFRNIAITNSRENAIFISSGGGGADNNFANVTIGNTNDSFYDLYFAGSYDTAYFTDVSIRNYSIAGSAASFSDSSKGRIKFLEAISASGSNFGNDIKINYNYVYVNASKTGLNKSANVTLYNLPTNVANPKLMRDGVECNATTSIACVNYTSLNAGNVVFRVSSWSAYSMAWDDTTPPNIRFVEPTEDSEDEFSRDYIEINVSASDDRGLSSITIRLFNSTRGQIKSNSSSSSMFYIKYTGLGDGVYYYNATATDSAGNVNKTETREITLDTTAPSVTINSPTATTYTTNSYKVNISLNEVGLCRYSLNSGASNKTMSVGSDGASFYANESGAQNGAYTLRAYCEDSIGNRNDGVSVNFSVNVGGAAPPPSPNITTNVTTNQTAGARGVTTTTTTEESNTMFYVLITALVAAGAAIVILVVYVYVWPMLGKQAAGGGGQISALGRFESLISASQGALDRGDLRGAEGIYEQMISLYGSLRSDEQTLVRARMQIIADEIAASKRTMMGM